MTIDQPIVALLTGWSLRRLAEVAGRHVGRTIRDIEEREFGPIADLPDEQRHSLEVLLPFAAAVHQAVVRRIRNGIRETIDYLRQAEVDPDVTGEGFETVREEVIRQVDDYWMAVGDWQLPEGLLGRRSTL